MKYDYPLSDKQKIEDAISFILNHGMYDGAHHKMWVIDQTLRILTDDEERYRFLLNEFFEDGEDEWDVGIAP